jgi:hypothetical protein
VRQGVDGSIRPRIGYLVNPWMMVYVTGGIAFNHVSAFYRAVPARRSRFLRLLGARTIDRIAFHTIRAGIVSTSKSLPRRPVQ